MLIIKPNPAAPWERGPSGDIARLARYVDVPSDTAEPLYLQAFRVQRRARVSWHLACAMAELAYGRRAA